MSCRRRRGARSRSEDGAVAVEFALVTPILLLLVFGIIDFGWMMNRDMLVDNVSRDATRVGALGGTYSQICQAARDELSQSGVTTPTACNGTITSTMPTQISIDCIKAAGGACGATNATTYDSNAVSGATVIVTVTYRHSWVTPLTSLVFGGTYKTIVETTRMVVE